jgi:two-component system response regulator HydG
VTSVLVVDDEPSIVESLRILLKSEGYAAHGAVGGRAGLERMAELSPDVVVSDVRMPGVDGLGVLAAARDLAAPPPVVLMTAQATLQTAIQAVNAGAFYYLQKPFRNDDLVAIVRRAAESRQLRRDNARLAQEVRRRDRLAAAAPAPLGQSRRWREALRLAEAVADSESTVLVTGESGTGKEVVAGWLHARSARAPGPFLSVNCGALPESLLESELFGHVKGSFTGAVKDRQGLFAAAGGGTFFLDEIGETTPATQVKLLRVLQQREVIPVGASEPVAVDARLVAATNRDLEDEVRRGRFRGDLYYRLNVVTVHLPPLRDRRDDVPLLAEAFLGRGAERRGGAVKALAPAALDAMLAYAWPGNVRELENAMERAVLLTPGDVIGPDALPERVTARRAEPLVSERTPASPTLEAIERAYIGWVLQNEAGNKSRAAEVLGIDPSTLYRKLARYGDAA